MTAARIRLEDIDPGVHMDVLETEDPVGKSQDLAIRMARKLRYTRIELADLEEMYDIEEERLAAARERACGPKARACESMERWLANWWLWEYEQRCGDAPDPSKVLRSLPLPDGQITLRRSTKIVTDPGAAGSLPDPYLRVKTEVDKSALKDALKAGELSANDDGRLVTADGELLDARVVEEDIPTVKTDGIAAE